MARITPFQIAMGIGTAGALVDVSSYADLAAGVQRSWGRRTEFEDIAPGVFSFVLDNSDGRFTPGNTASPLTTTVTEGMAVCWNAGGRLVAGTILAIEPTFPSDESAWAQIRITCDDMLGAAGRRELSDTLAKSMVLGSTAYLYWPFNDTVGSSVAAEQSGRQQPSLTVNPTFSTTTFGASGFAALGTDTQALITSPGGATPLSTRPLVYPVASGDFTTIDYAPGSMGCWGVWITPRSLTERYQIGIVLNGCPSTTIFLGSNASFQWSMLMGATTFLTSSIAPQVGVPAYLQMVVTYSGSTSITGELLVNGISAGTKTFVPGGSDPAGLATNQLRTPSLVFVYLASGSTTQGATFAHLSHTAEPVAEYSLQTTPLTESIVLSAIDAAVSGVTLTTLPTELSQSAISAPTSGSALDAFNDVLRTEQGAVYSTVTGTLTSPTQTLTVRERTRPTTVTASWDVARELDGAPQFVRDVTNMVSTITASGPTQDVTLTDSTLTARVGSSNSSESVLNTNYVDLLVWDQDRLQRGANVQLRVASVVIDAMTTPTDRTSDLLALVPGDRHQFTGLPSTQLGFSTWDGWLLGVDETHTLTEHTFTLYFQPVLPATAIYDTNYFMGDTDLTLSASITSGATTMSVATATTTTKLETATFPYTLVIDSEQVTVTACTGATPQVATITRGVNGTTAAAHSSGAAVEVAVPSLYAF